MRTAHNKLTQERVIEQFKEVHGDAFDYSKVEYVDTNTKVKIRCKKHDYTFQQIPKNHKKGTTCPLCEREKMSKLNSKGKEKFVEEALEKYGDLDDYSKVEYKNTKTEVTFTCKKHNLEYEKQPDHYLRGYRCPECSRESRRSRLNDKELFIQSAINKHGDEHDYTNTDIYPSVKDVEIRCKKHDHTFKINISSYLSGQKCPKCSRENYTALRMKTTEEFIKEAVQVWGDNNDYTVTDYKGALNYINVRCKKHDYIYPVLPKNHTNGKGCPKCKNGYNGKGHHHTKKEYVELANGRITSLYLIKCFDEYEEFYKIGKTFRGLKKRYTSVNMPYDYEEIFLYDSDAETIWDLEEELHKKYVRYNYRVNKIFDGYSECYTLKLPIQEIIDLQCQKE
jgi:hypothetical protein